MSTEKLGRAVKRYSETLRSNREQYSETGAIDWENKWKMRLLTTEVDIFSLVALSLNTCPEKAFEFLNKKKEIYKTEKTIGLEIRDFTDKHKKIDPNNIRQDIPLLYGLMRTMPIMGEISAIRTIQDMEKRLNIIMPHLGQLATKPVEINGIATVKCDIASFVELLISLKLPHPKKLDNYAIKYAGNHTKTYENLSNTELVPYVMESLGLDPLAYSLETISKEDIYNKARELYDKKFRMTLNSFARGGRSTWNKAKNAKLIKKKD